MSHNRSFKPNSGDKESRERRNHSNDRKSVPAVPHKSEEMQKTLLIAPIIWKNTDFMEQVMFLKKKKFCCTKFFFLQFFKYF